MNMHAGSFYGFVADYPALCELSEMRAAQCSFLLSIASELLLEFFLFFIHCLVSTFEDQLKCIIG